MWRWMFIMDVDSFRSKTFLFTSTVRRHQAVAGAPKKAAAPQNAANFSEPLPPPDASIEHYANYMPA